MRKALAFLLVASLVLFAFWLQRGAGKDEPRPLGPERAAGEPLPLEASGSASEEEPIGPLRLQPEQAERSELAATTASARAVGAQPEPEREVRLKGTVVDANGRTIAAATVELRDVSFFFSGEAPRPRVTVTTDAEGRFAIETRARGAMRLDCSAPRYAPATSDCYVQATAEQDLGTLVLHRGVVLSGYVRDQAGRPVEGAELRRLPERGGVVLISPTSPTEVAAVSDADGRFEIDRQAVGPYRFLVVSTEHPDGKLEGSTSQADEEQRDLLVELAPGARIAGHVSGIPPDQTSLQVRARGMQKGEVGNPEGDPLAELLAESTRTAGIDSAGRFELSGLIADQEYRLTVVAGQGFGISARSEPVRARAGARDVELVYLVGSTLQLQVVDEKSGEPLTRFTVSAGVDFTASLVGADGQPRREFPGGRVSFEGLRPRSSMPFARLVIDAVGYQHYERGGIEIDGKSAVDLGRIALARAPGVRAHVLSQKTGQPIEGASVSLREHQRPGSGERRLRIDAGGGGSGTSLVSLGADSAVTDAQGWAWLRSPSVASVELVVSAAGHAAWTSEPFVPPTEEDREQEILLTRGGAVRVLVLDSDGQPQPSVGVQHRVSGDQGVQVLGLGGRVADLTSDSDGIAFFDNLTPGRHLFQLVEQKSSPGDMVFVVADSSGGDESGWSEAFVSEGEVSELTLAASPRGLLEGVVLLAGEPLVGARIDLREGDLAEGAGERSPFVGLGGPQARSDGDGRFRFEDVRAGLYTLGIEHELLALEAQSEVRVEGGENRVELDLPTGAVEGRVLDAHGKPVAGAKVEVKRVQSGSRRVAFVATMVVGGDEPTTILSSGGGERQVRTDGEGRYLLRGVQSGIELYVEASHPEHVTGKTEPFQLKLDQVLGDRDLELGTAGKIRVLCRRPDGKPAANVLVRASYSGSDASDERPRMVVSRKDGEALIEGLRPGVYEIKIESTGVPGVQSSAAPQQVEVVAGQQAETSFRID